jgi:hypothetical protein
VRDGEVIPSKPSHQVATMAGDAGDVPQIIGSSISLISRSGIRYEGILHSINMDDSSIALKNGTALIAWLASRECRRSALGLRTACVVQCARLERKAGALMGPRFRQAMRRMSSSSLGVGLPIVSSAYAFNGRTWQTSSYTHAGEDIQDLTVMSSENNVPGPQSVPNDPAIISAVSACKLVKVDAWLEGTITWRRFCTL